MAKFYNWTDDAIETLRSLWMEGKSGAAIARDLGGGVTRNAIIGKVHRLGIQARDKQPLRSPITHHAPAPRPRFQLPSPHRPPTQLLASRIAAAEKRAARLACEAMPEGKIVFANLEPHHCRWPSGSGPFLFCGEQRDGESSYCRGHLTLSREPVRVREAA